jgi:hypothetical protein
MSVLQQTVLPGRVCCTAACHAPECVSSKAIRAASGRVLQQQSACICQSREVADLPQVVLHLDLSVYVQIFCPAPGSVCLQEPVLAPMRLKALICRNF